MFCCFLNLITSQRQTWAAIAVNSFLLHLLTSLGESRAPWGVLKSVLAPPQRFRSN